MQQHLPVVECTPEIMKSIPHGKHITAVQYPENHDKFPNCIVVYQAYNHLIANYAITNGQVCGTNFVFLICVS